MKNLFLPLNADESWLFSSRLLGVLDANIKKKKAPITVITKGIIPVISINGSKLTFKPK